MGQTPVKDPPTPRPPQKSQPLPDKSFSDRGSLSGAERRSWRLTPFRYEQTAELTCSMHVHVPEQQVTKLYPTFTG